jgi:hypothetical protein
MDIGYDVTFFEDAGVAAATFGYIDPTRALTIIDAYTLAFFQTYLKGMSSPLLAGPTPYGEVAFNKR